MKILFAFGEKYTADRIVKTDKDIIGYNNDSSKPAWGFYGISDFSQFQLAEEQEWDIFDEEQHEATIAGMAYELITKDLAIQVLEQIQANVLYEFMMKGVL